MKQKQKEAKTPIDDYELIKKQNSRMVNIYLLVSWMTLP